MEYPDPLWGLSSHWRVQTTNKTNNYVHPSMLATNQPNEMWETWICLAKEAPLLSDHLVIQEWELPLVFFDTVALIADVQGY